MNEEIQFAPQAWNQIQFGTKSFAFHNQHRIAVVSQVQGGVLTVQILDTAAVVAAREGDLLAAPVLKTIEVAVERAGDV